MELSWPSVLGRGQTQIPRWALLPWALSWASHSTGKPLSTSLGLRGCLPRMLAERLAQMCTDGTGLVALRQDLSPIHWETWLVWHKHTQVEGAFYSNQRVGSGKPQISLPQCFVTLKSKHQGFWWYQASLLPALRSNVIWKSYSHLPQVPCRAAVMSRMLWDSVRLSLCPLRWSFMSIIHLCCLV